LQNITFNSEGQYFNSLQRIVCNNDFAVLKGTRGVYLIDCKTFEMKKIVESRFKENG
jgi:hypothetical protein